jgi:hypothetical protein
MLESFQSRRSGGRLIGVAVAAALASCMAATSRPPNEADGVSGTAAPARSQTADSDSPWIDYLNAVGAATAAAEPSAPTISVLLAGTAPAFGAP